MQTVRSAFSHDTQPTCASHILTPLDSHSVDLLWSSPFLRTLNALSATNLIGVPVQASQKTIACLEHPDLLPDKLKPSKWQTTVLGGFLERPTHRRPSRASLPWLTSQPPAPPHGDPDGLAGSAGADHGGNPGACPQCSTEIWPRRSRCEQEDPTGKR